MEIVIANFSGKSRRETLDGRRYIVAPITLIVPGVLNGSKGAIFYDLVDITATVDAWNGMPITVNHPATSARDPKIIDSVGIGTVYAANIADGKLSAEGWFDIEKTRKVDSRILNALENGQRIEVSTGLGVDLEPANGVWNNTAGLKVSYQTIARRYRPDHLAILPDQPGACSLADGCGVNNTHNNSGDEGTLSKSPQSEENSMFKFTDPKAREAAIATIVANCACWKDDQKGVEALDDRTVNALALGVENEKALKASKAEVETLTAEKATLVANAGKVELPKAPEAPKALTMADLPEEIRNMADYGKRAMQKDKDAVIDRLVANIAAEHRKAEAEALNKKTLADLEQMAKYLPAPTVTNDSGSNYGGIYAGAGAGQSVDIGNNGKKYEPAGGSLGIPIYNWSEPQS